MTALRAAAKSFSWRTVFELLKDEESARPLASEAFGFISYSRHSSTMADLYRDLRDRVYAWCDSHPVCVFCGAALEPTDGETGHCPVCQETVVADGMVA